MSGLTWRRPALPALRPVALVCVFLTASLAADPAIAVPTPAKAMGAPARVTTAPRAPARSGTAAKPTGPVRADELAILARATEFDGPGHQYRVSGDVQLEVRDLKVNCAEATIFLSNDDDKVLRIVFTGEVVAVRGKSTFRGDRVTYNVATRKLLAEGNTRTRVILPTSSQLSRSR